MCDKNDAFLWCAERVELRFWEGKIKEGGTRACTMPSQCCVLHSTMTPVGCAVEGEIALQMLGCTRAVFAGVRHGTLDMAVGASRHALSQSLIRSLTI